VIRFGEEMAAPLLHGEESRTHFHAVAAQLAKHLGSVRWSFRLVPIGPSWLEQNSRFVRCLQMSMRR
jgi:hypothetical protein